VEQVSLSAVGDISLGGTVAEMISDEGPDKPFVFIRNEFKKGDVVFGNLESPLSNSGDPLKNKCCLSSPPEAVKSLKLCGFNVVSLANNHIFDYGYESFEKTVSFLDENNIFWFGAGGNLAESRRPAILSFDNVTAGFLGYSWGFIQSKNATKKKYGTAPLNKKMIIEDVRNLKARVDVAIVSLHWGYEREIYPLPSQRKLAHEIIDAGAHLILGHHPHVLQGMEKYQGGVIVYSLGNFIFPDIHYKKYRIIQKDENKRSVIFQCVLGKTFVGDSTFVPIVNCSTQPKLAVHKEQVDILEEVRRSSDSFIVSDYSDFSKKNRVRKDIPDVYGNYFNLIGYKIKKTLARLSGKW